MRRKDMAGYTLSQLINALDTSDPSDPHAGNIPLGSLSDLENMFEF